jgi:hypothetical protein
MRGHQAAHSCILNTQEAETGESRIPGQPVHSMTLPEKTKKKRKKEKEKVRGTCAVSNDIIAQ